MQVINGYKVDETKKFRLTKGKSEKIFDNYADAVAFMQKNYGYKTAGQKPDEVQYLPRQRFLLRTRTRNHNEKPT